MNAGDFLMMCKSQRRKIVVVSPFFEIVVYPGSNDLIKSTMHRVRAPRLLKTIEGMIPDRYSIVYVGEFFNLYNLVNYK